MEANKGVAKVPETESGRLESLRALEAEMASLAKRLDSVKSETQEMDASNRKIALENRAYLKVISAVNDRDYSSMKLETGLLERALNSGQRDINIMETQLRKLQRSCQLTDTEFYALLTAIGHFTTENDKLEAIVQAEAAVLTPAAMQAAFEIIQKSLSDKLAQINPEQPSQPHLKSIFGQL
jgi:chromosome segregation ATPase